jgi:uncharacterized protein
MRVVLDTNVIISGLLNPSSAPARILNLIQSQQIQAVMSPQTQAELARVLRYPKIQKVLELTAEEANQLAGQITYNCQLIQPTISVSAVTEDEADNRYLEVAVAAEARYLVTGDQHLLKLERYQGIEIVSPATFLATISAG